MRRIFSLILALVLCLSLWACGETEKPENGGNTGDITNDAGTQESETEGLVLTDEEDGYRFINQERFHEIVEVVELTLDNWRDYIAVCSYTKETVEKDAFGEVISTQSQTIYELGVKGEKYYCLEITIELKDKTTGELTVYTTAKDDAVEVKESFDLEQYECTRIKGKVYLIDVPQEAIWENANGVRGFTVRYSDIGYGPPMGCLMEGKDGRRVGGMIDFLLHGMSS